MIAKFVPLIFHLIIIQPALSETMSYPYNDGSATVQYNPPLGWIARVETGGLRVFRSPNACEIILPSAERAAGPALSYFNQIWLGLSQSPGYRVSRATGIQTGNNSTGTLWTYRGAEVQNNNNRLETWGVMVAARWGVNQTLWYRCENPQSNKIDFQVAIETMKNTVVGFATDPRSCIAQCGISSDCVATCYSK